MKQLLLSKSGKKDRNALKWIIGVVLIVIVVIVVIALIPERAIPGPAGCPDATGILTVADYSAIPGGTDPGSPTLTAGVIKEGQTAETTKVTTTVTSGTTPFTVGDEILLFASIGDYLDKSWTFTMPCGGISLDAPMYYSTSDNPAIEWQTKASDTVTNAIAGGALNISDVAAGGVLKAKLVVTGTALESSGDGIIVLEFPAVSDANITEGGISLGSLRKVTKPKVYTVQNAASRIVAFEVPALVGSGEAEYTLLVPFMPSLDVTGGVYTAWFNKQDFIDDDKTIGYGVEDSDGTLKYENTVTYDFFIEAS